MVVVVVVVAVGEVVVVVVVVVIFVVVVVVVIVVVVVVLCSGSADFAAELAGYSGTGVWHSVRPCQSLSIQVLVGIRGAVVARWTIGQQVD